MTGVHVGRQQLEQTYREMYETFALDATVDSDPMVTTLTPPETDKSDSLLSLPLVRTDTTQTEHGVELELGATLGQGGMGLVRSATQRPIGRSVAVKTLRADRFDDASAVLLLQEAIITGRLEHPNVVPIYGVGQNEEGAPIIVMKRIEGNSWAEYLGDPSTAPGYEGEDGLVWNLQVLMGVCRALTFAHDRGIVHRDIKPDNVMIGEFGEVYLVDWGIAVTTEPDGFLPSAADVNTPAGTPGFMSPEMAAGQGASIGPATDVYLLGAMLHFLVTGETPHSGGSLYEVMLNAYKSEPKTYAADVPEELASICVRAMAWAPEDRFESASAFRESLRDYLNHRDSVSIATESAARLAELKDAIEAVVAGNMDAELGVQRLFGECRFGFEQALKIWDENEVASRGVQDALRAMFDFEIHQRSPDAAAMLLAEMNPYPEDLFEQVETLRAELDSETRLGEELQQMKQDVDPEVGSRARGGFIVTVLFAALLGPTLFLDSPTQIHMDAFLMTGRIVIIVVAVSLVFTHFVVFKRKPNRVNEILGASIGIASLYLWLGRELGSQSGATVREMMVFESLAFFMAWLILGVAADKRIVPIGTLYLLAAVLIVFFDFPHVVTYVGCHFVGLSIVAYIWTRPRKLDALQ